MTANTPDVRVGSGATQQNLKVPSISRRMKGMGERKMDLGLSISLECSKGRDY